MIPLLLVICTAQSVSLHGRIAFPLSSSQLGEVPADSAGTMQRVIDRGGGIWGGVALEARVARFTATLSGLRGGLGGSGAGFPERDGGEVSAVVRYDVQSTFALEARHTTRVFRSAAGRQGWGLWGLAAVGSLNLGSPLARASGGFAYMPVVRTSGEPNPRFGVAGEFALSVRPRRSPLVLTAGYRIEKFGFLFASKRAEQFEALIVSVGLQMDRRTGRWGLSRAGEP